MTDMNRARFDALVQLVAESTQAGQMPNAAWLAEIEQYKLARPEWSSSPASALIVPPPPPPTTPPSAATPLRPGERILITVDEDMKRIVDSVLETWAYRVCVFQAGGKLFEVQHGTGNDLEFLACTPGAPRLVQVSAQRARFLASRECSFGQEKFGKDGKTMTACLPPEWLGGAIITSIDYGRIPVLAALAQAPTLRRDGAVIRERGYDASTGIYLAADLDVKVPDRPTQEDAQLALARLLDLISDFEFVLPAGRTAWLSGLLSVAARHTFNGPVPIVIIDAPKRGAGKTTLADIASIITTGVKACRMFYTDDDVEMDKRITSLGLAGEQLVLIDNIVGKLASPPLDAALTSDAYRGRVLGKTEMTPAMPMKIVWFATGNGLIIGADTARRALFARLEPSTDHPEDREGPKPGQVWKYRDLIGHVTQNRAALLSDALTIVKSYIVNGRPNMNLRPMGSFEAWSNTIRSAIVYAGGADPNDTVRDARLADLEDHAQRAMVACWPVADDVEVTTASLLEWAVLDAPLASDPARRDAFEKSRPLREQWRNALLEWLPARKGDLPTARELGYALRAMKGSIIDDYKIEAGKATKSGIPWKRVRIGYSSQTSPPSPTEETTTATPPSLFSVIR